MKKLFISLPMKGLSDEEINDLRKSMLAMAKIVFEQEDFEVIDSNIEEDAPEGQNEGLYYVGESIKRMADADFFIGIDMGYDTYYNGCWLENQAAERYNLNRYLFNIDKIYFSKEED